jgi:FtsZ-binding cell division protein ZapB
MSKLEDRVNEILGVESKAPVEKKEFKPLVSRTEDKDKADVDNDYKYSRENYYNLIEKGQEAIQGILDIAQEGQHPRAYEVAGQLIGQVATTVDKLQDLQKKLKDLKEVPNKTSANIKNALFVGSTAELQKMLKQNNEDIKSKTITPEETDISDK